jgi:hypothetical protein
MTYARAISHGAIFLAKRLATNNITRHISHAVLLPPAPRREHMKNLLLSLFVKFFE